MEWWQLVIVVLSTYLLLSLGPWLALQIVEWLLQRSKGALVDEETRLQALREGEQTHGALWPTAPRVGRYEEPDRMAHESLGVVSKAVAEADHILPSLSNHEPARLSLVDVLAWRAWGPLFGAVNVLREARALGVTLDQGAEALSRLDELEQVVQDLPSRVRALLNEQRAEAVRLSALCETEVERGTKGLDDVDHEISTNQSQIEVALDTLSQAAEADLPTVMTQADALIEALTVRNSELEQRLEQAALERTQAHDAMTHIDGALSLVEERWAELQIRGATEPAVARSLSGLHEDMGRLSSLAKQQTVDAYRETHRQITDLQGTLQSLTADLDHLDDLMTRSKGAMEGNLKALADSQAACDELVRQDVLLDPDRSLALIERATQAYMEAERQRGLGTAQGYESSLELARQAAQIIDDATKQAQAFPEQVQQVRELLTAMQPQALGEARGRADRLREQLQVYTKHWDRGLNADMAEAISLLDQAEVDLERLAPNVRYQRRFRQSETDEALDILSHVRSSLGRGGELIGQLDAERDRIVKLREQLEGRVAALTGQTIPALEDMSKGMLPDTKHHLEALVLRVKEQAQVIGVPSKIDYDDALKSTWPALENEVAQVRLEHERSVAEYEAMQRDTIKRLDRSWTRLARLQPEELPGPEEDVERLSSDLDAWHAQVEREAGNLPALRDLLGRTVAALEQRIEKAEEQIVEGRRRFESLEKDYRRHAQSARDMRLAVRELEQSSRWTSLHWDWARAEEAWQEAVRMERAGQQATKLAEAGDALQQARKAAEEADDLFEAVERQMASALRRLDDELRAVNRSLERAARQMDQARDRGDQASQTILDTAQSDAQRLVQAAVGSATFEEALRNLRDARKAIESV